jgi:hypothetical protein
MIAWTSAVNGRPSRNLGKLHDSTLAKIPESLYRPPPDLNKAA